jgi:hypothetical protein
MEPEACSRESNFRYVPFQEVDIEAPPDVAFAIVFGNRRVDSLLLRARNYFICRHGSGCYYCLSGSS